MLHFAQKITSAGGELQGGASQTGELRIGNLTVDGRAFLAPLAGVTDLAMRRLARRFGASLAFSEMVASGELAKGDRATLRRADGEGVSPHAVQIAGCSPAPMAEAARLAEASGADLIDINMGCPAKRVTGGASGSALMRDLDLAASLIRAVVGAVKTPVSVKMRLGWDETTLNAPELARRAENEGACMITVHGRTRQQFYRDRADWTAIGAVTRAVSLPVVANGDCCNVQDAKAMLAASGAAAVMVGRASLGQPWLVGDIAHYLRTGAERAPLAGEARRGAAIEHYQTLLALFGERVGLRHARKHLAAYADIAAQTDRGLAAASRRRLVESEDCGEVLALLAQLYDAAPKVEAA